MKKNKFLIFPYLNKKIRKNYYDSDIFKYVKNNMLLLESVRSKYIKKKTNLMTSYSYLKAEVVINIIKNIGLIFRHCGVDFNALTNYINHLSEVSQTTINNSEALKISEQIYDSIDDQNLKEVKNLSVDLHSNLITFNKVVNSNKPLYFIYNNTKIFIPFFSEEKNCNFYDEKNNTFLIENILELIYDYANEEIYFFEKYGIDIFKSDFSSLIYLFEDENNGYFYDEFIQAIIVINRQGNLSVSLPLYDNKKNKVLEFSKVKGSLIEVCKAYSNHNKNEFLDLLYKYNFISLKLYKKLCIKALKRNKHEIKRLVSK